MEFSTLAQEFLEKVFAHLDSTQIEQTIIEIDHLCYRTSSLENYEQMKTAFFNFGELLVESEVNGRDIATFKLNDPLKFKSYEIPLLEVPAPKSGKVTKEGFEHIEIVTELSFTTLIDQFSHLKLEKKGLNKIINPELEVEFNNCAIKWHHQSLAKVIEAELNPLIWDKVKELETLKKQDFVNLDDRYQRLTQITKLDEQELIRELCNY